MGELIGGNMFKDSSIIKGFKILGESLCFTITSFIRAVHEYLTFKE